MNSETTKKALSLVMSAIDVLKSESESKKVNAMIRKLTYIKADLSASAVRESVMSEVPAGRAKKEE